MLASCGPWPLRAGPRKSGGNWRPPSALVAFGVCVAILLGQGCGKKNDAILNPQTGPTAGFNGVPRSGINPLDVDFEDRSASGSSPITAWLWSFGDGTTSTSRNPSHLYASAGRYTVSLIVRSSSGSDTLAQASYIGVFVKPTAAFTGSPTSGQTPLTVQFTDQSTAGSAPITSWQWTFGDGGTSTARSPSHTYTDAGSYTVSLTITTSAGQDTQTKTSYVTASSPDPPTAAVL